MSFELDRGQLEKAHGIKVQSGRLKHLFDGKAVGCGSNYFQSSCGSYFLGGLQAEDLKELQAITNKLMQAHALGELEVITALFNYVGPVYE